MGQGDPHEEVGECEIIHQGAALLVEIRPKPGAYGGQRFRGRRVALKLEDQRVGGRAMFRPGRRELFIAFGFRRHASHEQERDRRD